MIEILEVNVMEVIVIVIVFEVELVVVGIEIEIQVVLEVVSQIGLIGDLNREKMLMVEINVSRIRYRN